MKTPPIKRTPTQDAVETAVRNAAKMWEAGYTVYQSKAVPTMFQVRKPNGISYLVDTEAGWESCECEQWKREGVCKHQRFVHEWQEIQEGEAMNDPLTIAESVSLGRYA